MSKQKRPRISRPGLTEESREKFSTEEKAKHKAYAEKQAKNK